MNIEMFKDLLNDVGLISGPALYFLVAIFLVNNY
jgi:hypothetical protein